MVRRSQREKPEEQRRAQRLQDSVPGEAAEPNDPCRPLLGATHARQGARKWRTLHPEVPGPVA